MFCCLLRTYLHVLLESSLMGKGLYVLMSGLDYEHLVLTASPISDVCECCIPCQQFGSKIWHFQVKIKTCNPCMYVKHSLCVPQYHLLINFPYDHVCHE